MIMPYQLHIYADDLPPGETRALLHIAADEIDRLRRKIVAQDRTIENMRKTEHKQKQRTLEFDARTPDGSWELP